MIAFLIYDINICGGTHKQLLKLLEYTKRQGQEFKVITKKLDLDKTYPGFRKFEDQIFVYDYYDYPDIFRHRIIRRLIPLYNKWKLKRLLENCDIINIHDNGFEEVYPLLHHKKVFWQINDLPAAFEVGASNCYSHDHKKNVAQKKRIIEDTIDFTAFTVNVGKNAERIKKHFNRNAYVFYCGIEPLGISINLNKTFQRFKNKSINLLTSGVFFRYRNYETQIALVKELTKRGYNVNLHIIGNTERDKKYADKIKNEIIINNLQERIIIEGQVDDERFKYLHENADFFLFINIDQSWGLAVFEAMSCGLPVLVSNSVGATEILNNNENSIFVDPKNEQLIADKIEHLVHDKDFYKRISAKASSFHEEWSWDNAYCSKMYNLMMS